MTYNVFGGTLNLAQPQPTNWQNRTVSRLHDEILAHISCPKYNFSNKCEEKFINNFFSNLANRHTQGQQERHVGRK